MSSNFRHLDAATLLGAWPLSPHPDGAGYSFQPEVTLRNATIRGIKREPSAGFILDGLAFKIYVNDAGPFTVNFSGGDPWSLDDVVAEINTDTSLTVAFNENGFLLLKSPTPGDGSYLRLESITSAEHVFDLLGLFSETESYAGDVASPGHPDPTRQVSYPGQVTLPWGAAFDAAAFNRVAIAMALNSDRTAGLIDRKRVAVRKEVEISYNGTDLHIQIPDMVYTGPVTPRMEDLIAILDDSHNEILVEKVITDIDDSSGSASVSTNADSGIMTVTSPDNIFTTVDAAGEWYVVFTGSGTPLDGLQLKVIDGVPLSADEAVVQNVDPATGERVVYSGAITTLHAQKISTAKVTAAGLFKESGGSNNVNQHNEEIYSSGDVTRVEKNNRVFCSVGTGADFSMVEVGDEVVWVDSLATDPWSNNGTYHVLRKVDAQTLDLIGEDGEPVVLNPTEAVVSGTITVQTDGEFWNQPFIKFVDDDVKPLSGTVRVIYLGLSTVRDAMTEDPASMAGSVRYAQETDFQVQKALIGIAGPSMDTFDDVLTWLYGDRRRSLEGAFNRLDYEHHGDDSGGGSGRHADIRPDTIDMFPEVIGPTVVVRCAANVLEDSYFKIRMYDRSEAGGFGVSGAGKVIVSDSALGVPTSDFYASNFNSSAVFHANTLYSAGVAKFMATADDGSIIASLVADDVNDTSYLEMKTTAVGDPWDLWLEGGILDIRHGATKYLMADSNRSELVVGMDLVPETDDALLLGSSVYGWKEIHGTLLTLASGGVASGVASNLTPTVTESFDLGASAYRWNEAYATLLDLSSGAADRGVASDLVPNNDNSRYLGAPSPYRWSMLYLATQLHMEDASFVQNVPSVNIVKKYEHLANSTKSILNDATFTGSDHASNTRYGVYTHVDWEGVDGGASLARLASYSSYYENGGVSTLDVTDGYGYLSQAVIGYSAGGKTVDFAHYYAEAASGNTLGLDKQYGLYVEALSLASVENWAIYTAGTTPSHLGGKTSIGDAAFFLQLVSSEPRMYADSGDYTAYNRTDDSWQWYYGDALIMDFGANISNDDFVDLAIGGARDNGSGHHHLLLSHYNDGAGAFENYVEFNSGNDGPDTKFIWRYTDSDAVAFRSAATDIFKMDALGIHPTSTGSRSLGTDALKWEKVYAKDGYFYGVENDPSNGPIPAHTRNSRNAVLARARMTGSGSDVVVASLSQHWNVDSGLSSRNGFGDYYIVLDVSVDPNSQICISPRTDPTSGHVWTWTANFTGSSTVRVRFYDVVLTGAAYGTIALTDIPDFDFVVIGNE